MAGQQDPAAQLPMIFFRARSACITRWGHDSRRIFGPADSSAAQHQAAPRIHGAGGHGADQRVAGAGLHDHAQPADLSQIQNNSNLDALWPGRPATSLALPPDCARCMIPAGQASAASQNGTLNPGQAFSVSYQTRRWQPWPAPMPSAVSRDDAGRDGVGPGTSPPPVPITASRRCCNWFRGKLTAEPANWSTMMGYTVYQYTQDNFQLQLALPGGRQCLAAGNVDAGRAIIPPSNAARTSI